MNIDYSIIIPHKNTPELLMRCVLSIPNSDNIEIIVVDDSSNEEHGVLIKKIYDVRSNVRIIYAKDNKGAGYARNKGVEVAKGKWLLFADADDFFEKGFMDVVGCYKDNSCDVIYFNAISCYSDTYIFADRHKDIDEKIKKYVSGATGSEDILRYFFYYPYCKVIKKDLVMSNGIKYDEIPITNDVMFSVMIGYYAKKISACDHPIYCLTVRPDSISRIKSEEHFDYRVDTALRVDKFMRSIGIVGCHYPILNYIIQSRKYGVKKIIEVLVKGLKNGSNILLGTRGYVELKVSEYFLMKKDNE